MKSDYMKELEKLMNEKIEMIGKCTKEEHKEFFRNEYARLLAEYEEAATNWVAIL